MVAVVEAAHVRARDDRAQGRRFNDPMHRRILAQHQLRAAVLVIVDVRPQDALQ